MSDSEDDVPLGQRMPAPPAAAPAAGGPSNGSAAPKPAAPAAAAAAPINGAAKPAVHTQGRQVVSDSDSEDEVPLAARAPMPAAPAAPKPAAPAAAKPAAPAAAKPAAAAGAAKPPLIPKRPGLLDDAVALPAAPRPPKPAPKPAPAAAAAKKPAAAADDSSDDEVPLVQRKQKIASGECFDWSIKQLQWVVGESGGAGISRGCRPGDRARPTAANRRRRLASTPAS